MDNVRADGQSMRIETLYPELVAPIRQVRIVSTESPVEACICLVSNHYLHVDHGGLQRSQQSIVSRGETGLLASGQGRPGRRTRRRDAVLSRIQGYARHRPGGAPGRVAGHGYSTFHPPRCCRSCSGSGQRPRCSCPRLDNQRAYRCAQMATATAEGEDGDAFWADEDTKIK